MVEAANKNILKMVTYKQQIFLCFFTLLAVTNSTLSPSDSKKKPSNQKHKSVQADVFQRGLVIPTPHSKDILAEHKLYSKQITKRFGGLTLGYVTPWNEHGYNMAETFSKKFTHVSPVWLQIRRQGPISYSIGGTHSISQKADWVEEVRRNKDLKFVPRVLFENWTVKDFNALSEPRERTLLIKNLVNIAKLHQFDGLVIEVWSQIASTGNLKLAVDVIQALAQKMESVGLQCILVIPPSRGSSSLFGKEHFDALAPSVTAFSIMTYDFSSVERPGPNSPLPWVRDCILRIAPSPHDVRRSKILMGLNFYGNDYTPNGGEAIINHQYLSLVKQFNSKLRHDNRTEESFFETKSPTGRHFVFYPSLYSIHKRIELAKELNVGIAIWELGQGLDYFYDLL